MLQPSLATEVNKWIYACVRIVRKIPIDQVIVYVRGGPLEKCGGGEQK